MFSIVSDESAAYVNLQISHGSIITHTMEIKKKLEKQMLNY
jgi:hypothetical protein